MSNQNNNQIASTCFPDGRPVPDLMTEREVIEFLRIPEVTTSTDHHNVIYNLKRHRDLPRIHICKGALFPRDAVVEWIKNETVRN